MGALDIDFATAMDNIGILAGSNFASLTYEEGRFATSMLSGAEASNRSTIQDVEGYYVSLQRRQARSCF